MGTIKMSAVFMVFAVLLQGCMTTTPKKTAAKKQQFPSAKLRENYALMDGLTDVDQDIIRRGNKARGTDEY